LLSFSVPEFFIGQFVFGLLVHSIPDRFSLALLFSDFLTLQSSGRAALSSSKRVRGLAHLAPVRFCSRQQCPVSLPLTFVARFDLARLLVISPGHCSVRFRDLLLPPVFHQEALPPSVSVRFNTVLTKAEF
jgi:hypothetical protein